MLWLCDDDQVAVRLEQELTQLGAAPAVLPLLRHLGGEFAEVESLWQRLISAHPHPSRAVVIEVGVADGTQVMYAAEFGVRAPRLRPHSH